MASSESVLAGSPGSVSVKFGTKAENHVWYGSRPLPSRAPELGGAGLAGDDERQIDEVERVAAGDDLARGETHDAQRFLADVDAHG